MLCDVWVQGRRGLSTFSECCKMISSNLHSQGSAGQPWPGVRWFQVAAVGLLPAPMVRDPPVSTQPSAAHCSQTTPPNRVFPPAQGSLPAPPPPHTHTPAPACQSHSCTPCISASPKCIPYVTLCIPYPHILHPNPHILHLASHSTHPRIPHLYFLHPTSPHPRASSKCLQCLHVAAALTAAGLQWQKGAGGVLRLCPADRLAMGAQIPHRSRTDPARRSPTRSGDTNRLVPHSHPELSTRPSGNPPLPTHAFYPILCPPGARLRFLFPLNAAHGCDVLGPFSFEEGGGRAGGSQQENHGPHSPPAPSHGDRPQIAPS